MPGHARARMPEEPLHHVMGDAGVDQARPEGYLYLILKKAWSVAVSASEARGSGEDKERSEEKRPWSRSCRNVAHGVADICEARRDQP